MSKFLLPLIFLALLAVAGVMAFFLASKNQNPQTEASSEPEQVVVTGNKITCNDSSTGFFADDPRNKPGGYYLEKSIKRARMGDVVVAHTGFKNEGSTTLTEVTQQLVLKQLGKAKFQIMDMDGHCKQDGIVITCSFYPKEPGDASGGAVRFKILNGTGEGDIRLDANANSKESPKDTCLPQTLKVRVPKIDPGP